MIMRRLGRFLRILNSSYEHKTKGWRSFAILFENTKHQVGINTALMSFINLVTGKGSNFVKHRGFLTMITEYRLNSGSNSVSRNNIPSVM